IDDAGKTWVPYATGTSLTGQSLINARRFLDARLPADRVRFDCGALGRMKPSDDSVRTLTGQEECHWWPEHDGFDWGNLKITDPLQRQKVRDFAKSNEKNVCPTCNGEGKVWESRLRNEWREPCPRCAIAIKPGPINNG